MGTERQSQGSLAWLLLTTEFLIFIADLLWTQVTLLPFMLLAVYTAALWCGPRITAALGAVAIVLGLITALLATNPNPADVVIILLTSLVATSIAVALSAARAIADRSAAESERRVQLVAEHAADPILRFAGDGTLEWASPSLLSKYGWEPGRIVGTRFVLEAPEDRPEAVKIKEKAVAERRTTESHRFRALRADGAERWSESMTTYVYDQDGSLSFSVVTVRDIHDQIESTNRLAYLATHDALTGLVNRSTIMTAMASILSHEPRTGTRLGVLFADLDLLKQVNDTYGHAAGDLVIRTMADRIRRTVRDGDIVARLGGDEYVVALVGLRTFEDAEMVAENLRKAALEPIYYEGAQLVLSMSIGVALAEDGEDPDSVVARADQELYKVKAARYR